MPADLILIVGCSGAGKTTYARRLADETGGIRFSIDEWMMALFWKDSPQPLEFAWTMERVRRCEAQILAMANSLPPAAFPRSWTWVSPRKTIAIGSGRWRARRVFRLRSISSTSRSKNDGGA